MVTLPVGLPPRLTDVSTVLFGMCLPAGWHTLAAAGPASPEAEPPALRRYANHGHSARAGSA